MALKKMKKTPTGWGTGYTNVDHIVCEKIGGLKTKCTLMSMSRPTDYAELIGTEVKFHNVDLVQISPNATGATAFRGSSLSCYLDSGIIECHSKRS